MATKRPRFMVSVDDAMFEEIQHFWHENQYDNRSAAVVDLLRYGLDVAKKAKKSTHKAKAEKE